MSKQHFAAPIAYAIILVAFGLSIPAAGQQVDVKVTKEAQEIHGSGMLFDGHNDLPWTMRRAADSSFDNVDISQPTRFHTDIPRLKKGGLKAQFWSVYVPAGSAASGNSLLQTLEQIELVHKMVKRYPDDFAITRTADEVEKAISEGKIASMMGVEGGHSIQGSLSVLKKFHDLGVRYMTLTHSKTLAWADSATDKEINNGLSPFGKEVVKEMNRVGILIDLSHVSDKTMKDALKITKAPVIFSHSSARAICDHKRNVPDDVLKLTKENGGVVMINFMSGYIAPTEQLKKDRRARGTVHDVVDHIEHVIKVAGIDHVGIGSDYDGVRSLPVGLEDVSTYPRITQLLLDRGYNKEQIHKILGGNVLRVLRESEKVAKAMQASEKTEVAEKSLLKLKVSAGDVDRFDSPTRVMLKAGTFDQAIKPGNYVLVASDIKNNLHATVTNAKDKGSLYLDFVIDKLGKGQSREYDLTVLKNTITKGFDWQIDGAKSAEASFAGVPAIKYMFEKVDNSSKESRQKTYKVYHHVYSPDGSTLLTKGPGGLFPHHRGIFFGFNRIKYGDQQADVWHCNKGESLVHLESLDSPSPRQSSFSSGLAVAQNTSFISWNGRDDNRFALEERTLRTYRVMKRRVIDFESTLNSMVEVPIKLDGDPQHAGVQFRATQHVPDKTKAKTFYIRPDGKGEPKKFRNWPGNKKHVNLPWNAMCFEVEGKTYTCCYLDHPDNPKPARFSERDYGRFGSYFVFELTKQKPLQVRYRFWIQEGEMSVEEIDRISRDFVNPAKVEIK